MWPPLTADPEGELLLAGEPQRQSTDSCAGFDGHGMHAHMASWFARLPALLQSNMISVNVKVGSGSQAGGSRSARIRCCDRAEYVGLFIRWIVAKKQRFFQQIEKTMEKAFQLGSSLRWRFSF